MDDYQSTRALAHRPGWMLEIASGRKPDSRWSFLPIVRQTTDRLGLARKYDQCAGQGVKLGLIKGDAGNIEQYVTDKALDGLYLMIGAEVSG